MGEEEEGDEEQASPPPEPFPYLSLYVESSS